MVMKLSSGPYKKSSKLPSAKKALDTMRGTKATPLPKNITRPPAPAPTGGLTKNYNTFQNVLQSSYGAGGGGIVSPGVIGGGGGAIPAPARPSLTMNSSNREVGDVDSTFRDQESAYNDGLKKFLEDIGVRRTSLKRDSKTSREGVARNRDLGMTGIGEDFAARGLGHSGLFVDAALKGGQSYDRQKQALDNAESDGLNELAFSETKEKDSVKNRIDAAKRDALYRLQLNNNLI